MRVRAAKIWTLVFLAVRRRSHCTSASNWDSKAWKFSHNERKSYAVVHRYIATIPNFTTAIRESDHTDVKRVVMSQLRLRMVRPWPDRFRRLWHWWNSHRSNVHSVYVLMTFTLSMTSHKNLKPSCLGFVKFCR